MIDLGFLKGETVAVLGLGKSGLATARALAAAGADVCAWDDTPAARRRAEAESVAIVDMAAAPLGDMSMLVLSPGIPRSHPAPHPVVARALSDGCPIVSDLDLLGHVQRDAGYIGITGTNGKSTTTALIGHILATAGVPVQVGGNLGTPALALDPVGAGGWYVLELSSFQLETVSQIRCPIAVFLNIAPDHLDRYPDLMSYVTAKTRLFDKQPDGATAVIGVDDDWSNAVFYYQSHKGGRRLVPVSAAGPVGDGVYVVDGTLFDGSEGPLRPVLDLSEAPSLPGAHNWQNAAAAYAAARAAGVDASVIADALRSFPGLRHRQELVAEVDGIRFVNDSKATNVDAAMRALSCYRPIYWIAGGRPKQEGLEPLANTLDRIAHAFLIGEAADRFAGFLDGRVPAERCGTLDRAVTAAFERARADGQADAVVLLSPACASFDQFTDFEARGDAFVEAVRRLDEAPPRRAGGGL